MKKKHDLSLFTLHDCLQEAALSQYGKISQQFASELMLRSTEDYQGNYYKKFKFTKIYSFCCDPQLAVTVSAICKLNGATMSSFLRACCKRLVEEYNYDNKENG